MPRYRSEPAANPGKGAHVLYSVLDTERGPEVARHGFEQFYVMCTAMPQADADKIAEALNAIENKHGIADVWHEGSKSFYRAALLDKLTVEDALVDGLG